MLRLPPPTIQSAFPPFKRLLIAALLPMLPVATQAAPRFEQSLAQRPQACTGCRGDAGEGVPGAYPALAGNRALLLDLATTPVRIVLGGGVSPSCTGNPQPCGMPPFASLLAAKAIAELPGYTRAAWADAAAPVTPLEVHRLRAEANR